MTTITNVVVLMLENRSYDNVLGALYMNQAPPPAQWSLDEPARCPERTSRACR